MTCQTEASLAFPIFAVRWFIQIILTRMTGVLPAHSASFCHDPSRSLPSINAAGVDATPKSMSTKTAAGQAADLIRIIGEGMVGDAIAKAVGIGEGRLHLNRFSSDNAFKLDHSGGADQRNLARHCLIRSTIGIDPTVHVANSHMLDPINHTATYSRVVDQIRRVIYLGRYLPGDKLPPERELAHQLGVSRTTVREAIRILEAEKLIRVKRGALGGIIVTSHAAPTGTDRTILTADQETALLDIYEFRFAVECHAVRLAAKRRTEDDIGVLARLVDEMTGLVSADGTDEISIAEYNSKDTSFHVCIARASRNPHLLNAVEEVRAAMFLPVGAIFDRLSERANELHKPILDAIVNQDSDIAEHLMREHITNGLEGLQRILNR